MQHTYQHTRAMWSAIKPVPTGNYHHQNVSCHECRQQLRRGTQIITVNDVTAPTITCPAPVTVKAASAVPAVNIASVTASDNCGGGVTVTWRGRCDQCTDLCQPLYNYKNIPCNMIMAICPVYTDHYGEWCNTTHSYLPGQYYCKQPVHASAGNLYSYCYW